MHRISHAKEVTPISSNDIPLQYVNISGLLWIFLEFYRTESREAKEIKSMNIYRLNNRNNVGTFPKSVVIIIVIHDFTFETIIPNNIQMDVLMSSATLGIYIGGGRRFDGGHVFGCGGRQTIGK
jgi:hypothetical protein